MIALDTNILVYAHRKDSQWHVPAERVVRSERLARLTELTLGFHYAPEVETQLVQTLADPSVMPRLRRLRFYGSFGNERPPLDGLRARFGLRLQA